MNKSGVELTFLTTQMKSVTTQTKPSIFTLPSREHWPSEDKFQKNRSTFADDFLNFLADRLPLTKQSKNGDVMSYFFCPEDLCVQSVPY